MTEEKQELSSELANLSQQIETQLYDEPTMKIVDILSDPEKAKMFSELTPTEIKLLTRVACLGIAFDDKVKKNIVETYVLLKVSNNRKGRTGLEGIGRHTAIGEMMEKTVGSTEKPGFGSRLKGMINR